MTIETSKRNGKRRGQISSSSSLTGVDLFWKPVSPVVSPIPLSSFWFSNLLFFYTYKVQKNVWKE